MNNLYEDLRSEDGSVYRISSGKGVCQVIVDGSPLRNKDTGGLVFPMPGVVFIANDFILDADPQGQVVLCPVRQGLIDVPYKERRLSDVRHLYIQTKLTVPHFPVFLRSVANPFVSGVAEGAFSELILVVPSQYGRDKIMKLRLAFPEAMIAVARHGQGVYVNPYMRKSEEKDSGVRATDIVASPEAAEMKNPSFAARVYLRNLQFEKMRSMIDSVPLTEDDVRVILAYIETMIQKAPEVQSLADVLPDLKRLRESYSVIADLLSGDPARVKKACMALPPDQLITYRDYLRAQQGLHNASNDKINASVELLDTLAGD